ECNGPLRYQLRKEISNFAQGNLSVTSYYTKLKCLWDEYVCIVALPECNCGAEKAYSDHDSETKLMQFLMGLNDVFESVKNQILLMEPFPTINRAYSMILKVEKQKTVNNQVQEGLDSSVMLAKGAYGRGGAHMGNFGRGNASMENFGRGNAGMGNFGRGGFGQNNNNGGRGRGQLRLSKEERAKLYCEHSGYNGHEIQGCFKLNGYPE
ncbi:Unknown protein, partial [Striga hermonthica]